MSSTDEGQRLRDRAVVSCLMTRRIEHAKALLRLGDLTVAEGEWQGAIVLHPPAGNLIAINEVK